MVHDVYKTLFRKAGQDIDRLRECLHDEQLWRRIYQWLALVGWALAVFALWNSNL
jgi:hypothetical protein